MTYRPAAPLFLLLAGLLSFAAPSDAAAPTPSLIANLNAQVLGGGTLVTTARLETRSVFVLGLSSGSLVVGDQIWATDGTEAGTIRLLATCDEICFDTFQIVVSGRDRAFFLGVESISRTPQLFVTDGTSQGTRRLTELPTGGRLLLGGRATLHMHWSERLQRLFFMADDSETGFELWSSDGTPEGTARLLDIFAGPDSSIPYFEFGAETEAGVIFTAIDEQGDEPWRTDGTPQGTLRLRDITPGTSFAPPTLLTQAGNRVVFVADDGVHGAELWSTDGTSQGTFLLLDATPGSRDIEIASRRPADGQAFFALVDADDPLTRRLLRTDGTPAGTRFLGDFAGVPGGLPSLNLVGALGADAVFTASGQLWRTDGTAAGTGAIECAGTACPQEPHQFRAVGDRLVFRATDAARGLELWQTDGTSDGTYPLADLCPGTCSSDPSLLGESAPHLYVMADDGVHGVELWSFSGSNPTRLTDLPGRRPFPVASFDAGLSVAAQGALGFLASDLENGFAVWATDGTPESTRAVHTIREAMDAGSNPHAFTPLGAHVLFAAHTEGQGLGLWRFGLPGRFLERIATLDPEYLGGTALRVQAVTTIGAKMFFADQRQLDGDIWMTDGSTGATRKAGPGLAFGSAGSDRTLPGLGSAVFFHGGEERPGLWITDGTPQGTRRLREMILAGHEPAVTFAGRVWFSGLLDSECQCEMELWSSDGTTAGTRPFVNLAGADSADPRLLTEFRGELYFVTSLGLFRTNGVAPAFEAFPDVPLGRIDRMTVLGNRLLLSIDSGGSEASLWATDGTAAGTMQIAPVSLRQAFHLAHPQQAQLGNLLFFLDGFGRAWRTDGTAGGTFPVDLFPPSVHEVLGVHHLPGHLLFITRDESFTERAWLSAGTAATTEELPGIQNVGPDVASFASRVFLSADDGRTGQEPWFFLLPGATEPPPPPPSGLPAAPRRLRAEGLSFGRIQLTWEDRSNNETSFQVQVKGSRSESVFETVATLPANTTTFVASNLEGGRPYELRVRAVSGAGASEWTPAAVGTPVEITGDCTLELDLGRVLCLQDDRFEVRVHWRHTSTGTAGEGVPSSFDFSDDSGTFWFFDPANVELVVKVLDARTVNGFQWVFYGALSNVEYWVTVTDTHTETNVTYYNPPREICGLGDVRAFPRPQTPGSNLSADSFPADQAFRQIVTRVEAGSTGPCTPGEENLCLSQDRYRVEVDWRDPRSGNEGRGLAIPGTADSGFFWFFDPANVELVVKVLDARTVNGHVWVFFGALTDVEYTVTVTDTQAGVAKEYRNEAGNICGQADVRAF